MASTPAICVSGHLARKANVSGKVIIDETSDSFNSPGTFKSNLLPIYPPVICPKVPAGTAISPAKIAHLLSYKSYVFFKLTVFYLFNLKSFVKPLPSKNEGISSEKKANVKDDAHLPKWERYDIWQRSYNTHEF